MLESQQRHRASVPHWDDTLRAHDMRRLNPAHHLVRGLVPHVLRPERRAALAHHPAYLPPFRVTEEDAQRGNAMVASTQVLIGTFGIAAAVDGFLGAGPTVLNPQGKQDFPLGIASVAAAILGLTFFGAAVGNNWYNAMLSLTARHWRDIQVHSEAARHTAEGARLVSVCAVVVGSAWAMVDQLQRALASPPEGPAAYNAVYENWLAFNLLVAGPHLVAGSNYYLGRVAGASIAQRLHPRSPSQDDEVGPASPDNDSSSHSSSRYESDLDASVYQPASQSQLTIRPDARP